MHKKRLTLSWVLSGILLLITSFLVGNYLGERRLSEIPKNNSSPSTNENLSDTRVDDEMTKEETPKGVLVSEAVGQIQKGMTYPEVVTIMGRLPDTVVTDKIRKELGESPNGYGEINFEWLNNQNGCLPITIIFDLSTMKVVDIGGANACFSGASSKPFGKPCSETNLCDVTLNKQENSSTDDANF